MTSPNVDYGTKLEQLAVTERIANGVFELIKKEYETGTISEEKKQEKIENLNALKQRIADARQRTQVEYLIPDQETVMQGIKAQK